MEHALLKELEQSLLFEKTKAEKLQRELEDSRVMDLSVCFDQIAQDVSGPKWRRKQS